MAVLPFRAAGAESLLTDFAARLRCALTNALNDVPDFNATIVESPFDHGSAGDNAPVLYTVYGTMRPAPEGGPGRSKVFIELAHAHSGILIWTHMSLTDARTPDRLADRLAALLTPRIHSAELGRIRGKHTVHLTAYDFVLQARELLFRFKRASFEEAGALLWQAILLEPNHPTAQKLFIDWARLWNGRSWSDEPARSRTIMEPT